jgi:hypothetical protein
MNEIGLTGGISYNLNTGEINPKEGYMVSLADHEHLVSVIDEETVRDYISQHANALAKENAFFGVWRDGKEFVLDVSEHYEKKRDAVFHAIVRKQKAIWDCLNRDEMRVNAKTTKPHKLNANINSM